MATRACYLITEEPGKHQLKVYDEKGEPHFFNLTADQIVVLGQQCMAHIWSYYKLVPRD